MYQLWLTPTSQQMMPSGGSTAWQSATTRSGRIGVAWISKFGRDEFVPFGAPLRDVGKPFFGGAGLKPR